MEQDLQAVFMDLRTMANGVLEANGRPGTEYPWEAIEREHGTWSKAAAAGDEATAARQAFIIDTLRLWYDALQHLGNTLIPARAAQLPWYAE